MDVREEAISKAVDALARKGLQAIAVRADVSSARDVEQMIARVVAAFGTIDILVNNAGVLRNTPIAEMTEAEWDLVLNVCLKAAFLCARAVLPTMTAKHFGKIVNISSLAARSTSVMGGAAYTAAKAGLLGFSRHLAREAAPFGINVNAVCPGAADTPMTRAGANSPEQFKALTSAIPLGRWSTPDEQASAVLFLVSNAASFITGATLDVNGGLMMV